jgi:hypothetical protein
MVSLLLVCQSLIADNVPVAPLLPRQDTQLGPVYTLESGSMEVVISPSQGGIISLRLWQGNEILETPIQIEFTSLTVSSSPEVPWEHRGWRTHEGNQVVMLHRSLPPPLSCRVIHLIELPTAGDRLRQTTRITGIGPGDQRLLKPTAHWRLKHPEHLWTREPYHIVAWQQYFTAWNVHWHIEDLTSSLEGSDSARLDADHVEIESSPGTLKLPPQGWTLICTLNLQINRRHPDQPAIELIHSWPPSQN